MSLQGKTALITGGTSGMGSATALAMAEKGASVIITGRDETRGASTVEKIRADGQDAQFLAADFSEMSEVARVADAAGEIDVLVNCAGFAALAPTADTDEAAFDGLFQINVKAPFFLVAALAPKIAARGGGSIINVSTMVASYGQPGMAAYGASRAAIELLTKAWAAEYGPENVRVNAVAPGPTLTPSVEPRLEMAEEFAKQIPLRRVAEVHELSDVITFLATPAAGYIKRGDHPRRRRPHRDLRGEEMRAAVGPWPAATGPPNTHGSRITDDHVSI
jgi:NAD(P)-dependent dehydrogenase (short-subunit alcohol dehydrogenase family)